MNIERATVMMSDNSCDLVFIKTDLPCPFVVESEPSQSPLVLEFSTTCNTGIDYVRENFGVEPDVINNRSKK